MGEPKPTTVAECLEHISDLYGEIEHSTRWLNDATEWDGDEDLRPRWQALYNKTHNLKERARMPDPRDARIAELEAANRKLDLCCEQYELSLATLRAERLTLARAHAHMLDASGETLPDLTNGEIEEARELARRIVAEAEEER